MPSVCITCGKDVANNKSLCAHTLWSSSGAKPGGASCTVCLCLWAVVKVNASTVGRIIWHELAVASPTSQLSVLSVLSITPLHKEMHAHIQIILWEVSLLAIPILDAATKSGAPVCVSRGSTVLEVTMKFTMWIYKGHHYVSCDYPGSPGTCCIQTSSD